MPEATLPPELLARLRRIELHAKRLVANAFVGDYHSVFRGRGIEFAEVRPYEPGDDVRAIDWNVTARMGVPYIKQYVEERELTVLLAVDLSASSAVASAGSTKRALAAEVAATLAFSAVANDDRVGMIAFTDRVEAFIPPAKGRRHVLHILRELLSARPAGRGTDIAAALTYLNRVSRRRALVFVISDFFDDQYETALRVAARRHELVAVTLNDPRESQLPDAGLLELQDPETGARAVVDSSSWAVRREYARRAEAGRARRRRTFAAAGVDAIELSTDVPYARALLRGLRLRERRR